jgi:hypothetical protein
MTRHTNTLINILLALAIVAVYAAMQNLDAVDNHSTEWSQSAAALDAINNEAARARFTRAAGQICGNSDFVELDNASIQCVPRRASVGKGAVVQVAGVAQ